MVRTRALLLLAAAGVPLVAVALTAGHDHTTLHLDWAGRAACQVGWRTHCLGGGNDAPGSQAVATIAGDRWTDPPLDVATLHAPSPDAAPSMSGVDYADVPADLAGRADTADRRGVDTTASIVPPSATGQATTQPSPSSRRTASLEGGGLGLTAPDGLSLFGAPSEVPPELGAPLPPVRPAVEKQTGIGAAPPAALPSGPPPNPLASTPRKLTRRPPDSAPPSASGGTTSRDVADISSRNLTVRPEARALLPPRMRPEDGQGAARSSTRVVVPLPARLLPDFEGPEQE